MTSLLLLATEAAPVAGVEWYAFVPSLVMLMFVVLTAPLWPWSRGWGWAPAGMAVTGLFVAGLFTLAWVGS